MAAPWRWVRERLRRDGRGPGRGGTPAGDPATPLRALGFVAIDTETTGLDPRRDALVALAAVPFVAGEPQAMAAWARLVNPGRPIPPEAQAIHGIGDLEVQDAEPVEAVLPQFLAVCAQGPVVAHTAAFDLTLINAAARRAGLQGLDGHVLDIGELAHRLFPSWWDLSLDGLCRLLETEPVGRHTAWGDAVTAGRLFWRMVPLLERRAVATLGAALAFQRRRPALASGPGATGGGLAGP
jgi:DNA polymerase III epsilon subunit-like protein